MFNNFKTFIINELSDNQIIQCSHFAEDIPNQDELQRIIVDKHEEYVHPGVTSLYEHLKHNIYHKDLKKIISKVTNECETCLECKYDRNPIRAEFKRTEIPNDVNSICHVDTYVNQKQAFVVFIDKFSKFATVYPLETRTTKELIDKLKIYFVTKKPRTLVADNEFKHQNIKEFLRSVDVNLHLCKPNSHTGNADAERLNNTLSEKIRIFNSLMNEPVREQMIKAVESYNNFYHSTIRCPPIKVEQSQIDKNTIYNHLIATQNTRLEYHNKFRENYTENRTDGFIKNYKSLRHKETPKFRKHTLSNIHTANIKRPRETTN